MRDQVDAASSPVLQVYPLFTSHLRTGESTPGMAQQTIRADYERQRRGAIGGDGEALDSLRAQEVSPGDGCSTRGRINTGDIEDLPRTVEAAIAIQSCASSLWMRRYPHEGFSVARRRTRRRIDATVRGRPGLRFTLMRAWRCFIKSRCHLSTVSGLTKSRSRRSVALAKGTSRAANNALSSGRSLRR